MRRHGYQPAHSGSDRPTPPTGGSGVKPPPAAELAAVVEYAALIGAVTPARRESLRQAAAQLRTILDLRAEVERLRAELACAYARAPHLARPTMRDADLPAVGSFSGG